MNLRSNIHTIASAALAAGAIGALILPCAAVAQSWTVTVLHPAASFGSQVYGVTADQQVGSADAEFGGYQFAHVWSGTSASAVSLHPPIFGARHSGALATTGTHQAGWVAFFNLGNQHAALWSGTAASFVDLHPTAPGITTSEVTGMSGTRQVGGVHTLTSGFAGMWQGTPGSWTDLHPAWVGATGSWALGAGGDQQVGGVAWHDLAFQSVEHAALWRGSAASFVDLHPAWTGAYGSVAFATTGAQQAGSISFGAATNTHAGIWSGTSASWVDLHPAGAGPSIAKATIGTHQAGHAYIGALPHAGIWSGTAASWLDLHAFVAASYTSSAARSIARRGSTLYVGGFVAEGSYARAALWTGPDPCYPDCNADGALTVADFGCFQTTFVAADPYADCNADGALTVADFGCFQSKFAAGCP